MERVKPAPRARLAGGVLGRRFDINYENLFRSILPEREAESFEGLHDPDYAEIEFSGKYIDLAVQCYRQSGDERDLACAREVVESILKNQRGDGYMGGYKPGLEYQGFSLWNQAFVIHSLVVYWDETGDRRALDAATACGRWAANAFLGDGKPDLLDAINQGVQHLCILYPICCLYERTGDPLLQEFAQFMLDKCERTPPFNLLSNAEPMRLASQKGIEMLIVYLGVLAYGRLFSDARCLEAAKRYWQHLLDGQITPAGCGTVSEMWRYHGNRPCNVSRDLLPNENCVAVGWMEFSLALYTITGDARYYDAYERTLYNHLFGSQAPDGRDFAYYQGNYGRKEDRTQPGLYKCCRYRGMTIFTHLPESACFVRGDQLALPLFTPFDYDADIGGTPVRVAMRTDYPRSEVVDIALEPGAPVEMLLMLRVPGWCEAPGLVLDGEPLDAPIVDGHFTVRRTWDKPASLRLTLPFPVRIARAVVDDAPSVSVEYGPLLLAIDSRYGTPVHDTQLDESVRAESFKRLELPADVLMPMVRIEAPGAALGQPQTVTLVDYASAGALDNQNDRFLVWIPTRPK